MRRPLLRPTPSTRRLLDGVEAHWSMSTQVEGSECIVTKAKGNERYEVKFAGARKFTDGGR